MKFSPFTRLTRRSVVATVALIGLIGPANLAAAGATAANPPQPTPDVQPITPPGFDGRFTPLSPTRLFDTRDNTNSLISVPTKKLTPGAELMIDVDDLDPIEGPQIVQALALNLTAADAESGGYVVAYECGTPAPTSNLNVQPGSALANSAIVSLPQGANKLCFKASTTLNLLVDLTGFFSITVDDASTYVPVAPKRVFDTRDGKDAIWTVPLGQRKSGDVIKVPITDLDLYGTGDEPVSIDLRVTTAGSTTPGYVVAYPCAKGAPTTSTVNLSTIEARTNAAIIPVDAAGDLCIKAMGSTHIILDVTGYFTAGAGGLTYVPVEPIRAVDTRPNFPSELSAPSGKLPFDALVPIDLGSLDYNDLDPKAVTANLTTTNADGAGHLRAWPFDQRSSGTSIHNYPAGPIARASASILGLSANGFVTMGTSYDTDVIIDVTGIFID